MARKWKSAADTYIANGGVFCPRCESREIEGVGGWETDEMWATHEMACLVCNLHWQDGYTLGFVVFDKDDVNPDDTLKEVDNG